MDLKQGIFEMKKWRNKMGFRTDNSELYRKILTIIKKCDSEYGNLYEEEGAELIMKEIEKLMKVSKK